MSLRTSTVFRPQVLIGFVGDCARRALAVESSLGLCSGGLYIYNVSLLAIRCMMGVDFSFDVRRAQPLLDAYLAQDATFSPRSADP